MECYNNIVYLFYVEMKDETKNEIDECLYRYFNTLKNIKPLSKKNEQELMRKYKLENDLKARDLLILSNLKYACKLASGYRGRGVTYYDLITEANCGLIESIDRFDIEKDVKVISYSKWYIIQRMQSAIKKCNKIKESDLPTDEETQSYLDDDDAVVTNNTSNVPDVFLDDEPTDNEEQYLFLENIFKGLNDREKDMINMYYGRNYDKEYTLEEIGDKYKLTKERVRQIIEIAFRKIRTEAILIDSQYLSR